MNKSRLSGWMAVFAGVAAMSCAGSSATNMGEKTGERNTADVVSLNPNDANSYRSFAPILETTKARLPQLDPATQLYVAEVKPNLFYVSEGIYQSAFLKTGAGVIIFDAPPSFAYEGTMSRHRIEIDELT